MKFIVEYWFAFYILNFSGFRGPIYDEVFF